MPHNSEEAFEPMDPAHRAELLAHLGGRQRQRDASDDFARGRENKIAAHHGLPLPHLNGPIQMYGDIEPAGINNNPEIFDIVYQSLYLLAHAAGQVIGVTGITALLARLFHRTARTDPEPEWQNRISPDQQRRFARIAQTLIQPFAPFAGEPHR